MKISYLGGPEEEIGPNEERVRRGAREAPNVISRGASGAPTPQEARKAVEVMALLKRGAVRDESAS